MKLFAMHFFDKIGRHLAGTESRHLYLRGNLFDLCINLGRDFISGQCDRIGALEPFISSLLDSHGK